MNNRHCNILGHDSQRAQPARRRVARSVGRGARGFTLIELLVVLGIMAIVTALTVGTFKSLGDNNQRTGCEANLQQVYQGLRLYMNDEAGQAPLYNPNPKAPEKKNIGLWALWTFPDATDPDKIAKVGSAPTARYMRSSKVLHCPSDTDTGAVRVNPEELYTDANKTDYNPDFLSYQMFATDGIDKTYSSSDKPSDIVLTDTKSQTYLPTRATDIKDAQFKRQLRQPITPAPAAPALDFYRRPPLDSTIVTWCRHHRYMRDYDNVLFFDGSVQFVPREQDEYNADGSCTTTGTILKGSDRVPRRVDCE